MTNTPDISQLIGENERALRDAVHVAISPARAVGPLQPGQHIVYIGGIAYSLESDIGVAHADTVAQCGVVSPFLRKTVLADQRFWLLLYPNTVTSLRHAWTHPAFAVSAPPVKE